MTDGLFTVRIARTNAKSVTTTRDFPGLTKKEAMAFMRAQHSDAGVETPFDKVRIDKFDKLYVFHMPSR